jgi:hypothetical protein
MNTEPDSVASTAGLSGREIHAAEAGPVAGERNGGIA